MNRLAQHTERCIITHISRDKRLDSMVIRTSVGERIACSVRAACSSKSSPGMPQRRVSRWDGTDLPIPMTCLQSYPLTAVPAMLLFLTFFVTAVEHISSQPCKDQDNNSGGESEGRK
jgi:hypothetical protein